MQKGSMQNGAGWTGYKAGIEKHSLGK